MTPSIGAMVKQINGLAGTREVSAWESDFITNIAERTDNGRDTTVLTGKQVEIVERIYQKNFA